MRHDYASHILRDKRRDPHWLFALLLALLLLCLLPTRLKAEELLAPRDLPRDAALDLGVLRASYPGAVRGMARGEDGRLLLVMADGARLVYDDGRERTPAEAEADPDVKTMLRLVYPLGPVDEAQARPAPGFDPGRWRVQGFFKALYGHSEAEVRQGLSRAAFDGRGVPFSARQGAAQALARVGERINRQLPQHPEWLATLRPFGGSFCWRFIAGTKRLSMHSFAAAMDLNPHLPYWRSEPHPERVPGLRRSFPPEIIAAFEAEGFIWGGKWASFDLMHFEYRPELILKARVLKGEATLPQPGPG